MKPRTHYKLVVDDKTIYIYDHPVKAEFAADHYFKRTGVKPTIEAYKKIR